GRLLNDSTHFFIGNGLMFLLVLRLFGGTELKRRDRIFNIVVACILVGVGCTIILDYRFILILIATIILIPRSLMELESESFDGSICQGASRDRTHPNWTAYLGIIGCMILFFLVFPRGLLGGAIRPGFFGRGNQTSLMESVLDPSQGGLLNSKRIILQIEGENPGYLRTFALTGFDGSQWNRGERNALTGIRMTSDDQLDGYLYRRVRVKDIGPLGKVLPTDGYLMRLDTTDFASRPMRTLHDLIWCARMRNTANKSYEYWIDPNPKPKKLLPQLRERYTAIPAQSEKLQTWLKETLDGIEAPYDQAKHLQSYLQNRFTYTLGAPRLSRLNPTDDFLLNQKEGHCERFASAMAILLRMQSIPSRIILGYVPGAPNWFSGWRNVRLRDAHAWTEGYFEGKGWVQLDATPRANMEIPNSYFANVLDAIDVAWYLHIVNFDAGVQKNFWTSILAGLAGALVWARNNSLFILILLMIPILAFIRQALQRFMNLPNRSRPAVRQKIYAKLADHYYGQMLKVLRRQGFERSPSQTPNEFLIEITRHNQPNLDEIQQITHLFCWTKYGNNPISKEQKRNIDDCLKKLKNTKTNRSGETG
ncbi:MAG TPA: DUF3488 domain-containing protein, partial [Verrucomicrobia bacterium]|nr:DUF3488 domain-containing protein [Verrucomicrobiota bacterium]